MIDGPNRLPEAVVAKLGFVDPSGVGNPVVIDADNLRAELRRRLPLWPQDGDVALDLEAIAEKVAPRNAVTLIEMMVAFNDKVVVPIVVGETNQ